MDFCYSVGTAAVGAAIAINDGTLSRCFPGPTTNYACIDVVPDCCPQTLKGLLISVSLDSNLDIRLEILRCKMYRASEIGG